MTPQRILITGASAGIGLALARFYARPGVTLALVARRADRLEALRAELEPGGVRVLVYAADVRDAPRMAEVVRTFGAQAGGVDLAIANAGISLGDRFDGDPSRARDIFAVNVQGLLNTLLPCVPLMEAQGAGHLVGIGSVAGFRGLPGKAAYSASKAAVKQLLDGWRPGLRRRGIRVTTICPGFVATELTAKNPYPMPFLMGADKAARLTGQAIARGAATYVFPWQMRLLVPLLKVVPDRLLASMNGRS
jgi:hypothetical protein